MGSTAQTSTYNRTSFTRDDLHGRDRSKADFQPNLHVGMEAVDFPLVDLDGRAMRLSDYWDKKHLVVEFGCITAPVFINDLSSLHRMQRQFKDQGVQFLIIYAREAHPGAHYPAHTSFEQKLKHAQDLKHQEKVDIPVLVDSLEGHAHHAYGVSPSPVYAIDKNGIVVYKSSWLNPGDLKSFLAELLRSEALKASSERMSRVVYSEKLMTVRSNYEVHEQVFERAGPGAREDVNKAFGVDPVELARKQNSR